MSPAFTGRVFYEAISLLAKNTEQGILIITQDEEAKERHDTHQSGVSCVRTRYHQADVSAESRNSGGAKYFPRVEKNKQPNKK